MSSPTIATTQKKPFSPGFPRLSVLDRYLATQLMLPFSFGVAAFSSIGVSIGALFELIRKITTANLSFEIAVQVFFLQMPLYIFYALPMSMLLSTLILYSRLSTDSELIALRSAGISAYRLVVPTILAGIVVTAMSFAFNEAIVPMANSRGTELLQEALNEGRVNIVSNIVNPVYESVTLPDGSKTQMLTKLFYAQNTNGKEMNGVTILDLSEPGMQVFVAGQRAVWNNEKSFWDIFDGTSYTYSVDGTRREILKFQKAVVNFSRTPLDLANRKKNWEEMTIAELQDLKSIYDKSGNFKESQTTLLRIQQKTATPFVCLVFALVGATLGMRPNRRSGKGASFAISIVIIFGYYLLAFICDAMGNTAVLSPFVAAWLPTIVGLTLGAGLLVKAAK
jgi:lipopolysaccharide export system permease protein